MVTTCRKTGLVHGKDCVNFWCKFYATSMSLLKLVRLPLFALTTLLILSAVATPTVEAQSCPAADADDGSSDGVITINSGGTTTWTDTDGTAFDCATLSITVTNSSTLSITQDSSNGYDGQINAVNLQVDSGSTIEADEEGCASSTSSSLSTNICADGGTYEGTNGAHNGGGGGSSGDGGNGQNTSGGAYGLADIFAPELFGAGGGASTSWVAAGGAGGGSLRINLSGNLTNNGTISVNGGDGTTDGGVYSGSGGGAGGSLYITVAGNIASATGVYQAKGGAGGNGTKDGGGGGGGFVYVEYDSSSIATTSFPTYAVMTGGTATDSGNAGSDGSALFKNTATGAVYFSEGTSRLPMDSTICSANTCTMSSIEVESGAGGQFMTDTSAGTYITVSVTGNVNVKSGGSLTSDEQGCDASESASLSTNICAGGGTYEGADQASAAGGAGMSGVGGGGSIATSGFGGTFAIEDPFAPVLFGAGGGNTTSWVAAGGVGGGALRLNITGNLTNNGTISANGGAGTTDGTGYSGSGGGAAGSVYITVGGNIETATGVYQAIGGAGGDGGTRDGGGGGGGFVYVEYDSSSIATTSFPTYAVMTGGTATGSGNAGSVGSAMFKNTNTGTVYFSEGISRVPSDSTICSSNTCTMTGVEVENGAEARFTSDTSAGTYLTVSVTNDVNVKSGGRMSTDEQGCASTASSSLSTNICASGGTYEGGDDAQSGGGASASGLGGDGSSGGTAGARVLEDVLAPVVFGAGGGNGTNPTAAAGGAGGGVMRLSVGGDLTNNGAISANGENGVSGAAQGGGGGAGGSLYITVSGDIVSATGTYESKGGDGGDGGTYDGGGGGGGFVYVEYLTSSIATGSLATYTDMSGGAVTGSATAGSAGSAIFKDTTTSTTYFIEGVSRLPIDSSVCAANTCSIANIVAESGGEGRFLGNTSTGAYMTVEVSGDVNVKSGGKLSADESGCDETTSANVSTNACADGGSSEGSDDGESGGGGAHGGVGGDGSTGGGDGGTTTYGDSTAPVFFGSGGGRATSYVAGGHDGGAGGGVLLLSITGTLTQNGTISADAGDGEGGTSTGGGGGAGGSVYLVAGTLAGSSTAVYARGGDGGDGSNWDGGGGAGGRVCVAYSTDSSTWLGSLTAATNSAGGSSTAGTDGSDGSLDTGTCTSFNAAPTVASLTFSQATDGTGYVTGTVSVDDPDDDTDVQLKIEYSDDGGGSYNDLTLIAPTSAGTGTPTLDNDTTYQIAGVTTASGANTVTFTWDSKGDGSFDVSNARFKITPYDTAVAGTAVETSDSVLDNIAPVTPTFSYSDSTDSETVTISASAAEASTNILKNSVDTGDDVPGDGTFTISVDLVDGVNTNTVTTTDAMGNTSTGGIISITKSSAGGGTYSSSTTTTTTTETSEETTTEEATTEESTEEEYDGDEYSMAGDDEEPTPDISDPGDESGDQSSVAGESQTQDDDVDEEGTGALGGDEEEGDEDGDEEEGDQGQSGGGSRSPLPAQIVSEEQSKIVENVPRILRFFDNKRLFGDRNEYGVPLTFIDELQVDFGESYDADKDGVTDYNELLFGTDPYLPNEDIVHLSIPSDLTDQEVQKAIDDFIEETGRTVDDIKMGDFDLDGLSDLHEIWMGMNPKNSDSDGDGFGDGEELMFYGTDPTKSTAYNTGIVIGNFIGISDASEGAQLITGHTHANSVVSIFELTDVKDKRIGQALSDENGLYSVVSDYMEPGEHTVVATSKLDGFTIVSNVIILKVSEGSSLTQPEHDPEVLDFGDKVYVSEAFIGLMPVLDEVIENDAIIMLTWESTIFGQTIITDVFNYEGTVIFRPPSDLDLGRHEVSWFAIDPVNGLRSTSGKIEFSIVPVSYSVAEAKENRALWFAILISSALLALLLWLKRGEKLELLVHPKKKDKSRKPSKNAASKSASKVRRK